MAKKKTVAATPSINWAVLQAVIEATARGAFVYTAPADYAPMVTEGLVEINATIVDANGGIATRATQKGIDQMAAKNSAPSTGAAPAATAGAAPAAAKRQFTLDSNIPLPPVTGRGRTGESIYPFDDMEVGNSFFVEKESKNLASTISSANARFAEVVPGQTRKNRKGEDVPATRFTRKFVVRSVTENGVKGSRIWRMS